MSAIPQSPPPAAPPTPDPNPAYWVTKCAALVPTRSAVLDIASGSGRHTRLFLERGHPVTALDRNTSPLDDIKGRDGLEIVTADIENGPWPLDGREFAGIVVFNYLHRALLPTIAASLAPGGVLIYQTFARGNERYGKPSNPDFLLRPNELLEAFADELEIVAFEAGEIAQPRPSIIQRMCAIKRSDASPSYRMAL